MVSFQSLADSSERVWQAQARFQTHQLAIASQGTAKGIEKLLKSLQPQDKKTTNDADKFKQRHGGKK